MASLTLSQGAGWSVSRCSWLKFHVVCFSNSANRMFSNSSFAMRSRLLSVTFSGCVQTRVGGVMSRNHHTSWLHLTIGSSTCHSM